MTSSNIIRKEVMAAIINVIAEAESQGKDGVTAARAAFPGTPEGVLWEAWAEHDTAKIEQWWKAVERTIDGEIIRNALAAKPEGA
ncbi:MAG: hypothetical protein HC900_00970 [Methylacidiphilales bacterium]|nr:hypothetical protein [Candidatus Methylacidiphilales bacterium]